MGLTWPLNQLVPHTSRMMQTMIQGSSDIQIWPLVGGGPDLVGRVVRVSAELSRVRRAGEVQISLGCHTFKNRIRQAMEISEAPMSTIHGLTKFEIRNCGTANETPVTRIAGQISIMPRQPANAHTTQNGTISEKNGSWRPTMAPSRNGSRPVTLASPAIGV